MSLHKKTYVKNWSHMKPDELHSITIRKGDELRTDIKPERITHIVEEVAEWRKANQIHKWFVDNVQDGNDDCKEYYVSEDDLEKLLKICQRVLSASILVKGKVANGYTYTAGIKKKNIEAGKLIKDSSVAEELLPAQDGFFFGGTDYDQWYLEDVKYTVETLSALLSEKQSKGWPSSYFYSSSW